MKTPEPRYVCDNWDDETDAALAKTWQATVQIKRKGHFRPEMRRKVVARKVVNIECPGLMAQIAMMLRAGCEVRLNESIRIYPVMKSDLKTMYACAQAMRPFSACIEDKHSTLTYRGEKVVADKIREEAKKIAEERRAKMLQVTPDLMVTCPQCGIDFRVGRSLARMR